MGWLSVVTISESIFSTLVRALYLRAAYAMSDPIISTIIGVENCLDSKRIYHIFDIAPVGLRVYKSKMWSIVPNFEPREAIQRIYGLPDAHRMGKPSTHSLTSSVEYYIICCVLFFYHEADTEIKSPIMRHSL